MIGDISHNLVPREDHGKEVPKEACRLHGSIPINKVKGNFHILSGNSQGTYGDFSKIPILPPTHPLRKLNNKKVPRYFSKFALETPTPFFSNKKNPFNFLNFAKIVLYIGNYVLKTDSPVKI